MIGGEEELDQGSRCGLVFGPLMLARAAFRVGVRGTVLLTER